VTTAYKRFHSVHEKLSSRLSSIPAILNTCRLEQFAAHATIESQPLSVYNTVTRFFIEIVILSQ
jgi:hypothetical protein